MWRWCKMHKINYSKVFPFSAANIFIFPFSIAHFHLLLMIRCNCTTEFRFDFSHCTWLWWVQQEQWFPESVCCLPLQCFHSLTGWLYELQLCHAARGVVHVPKGEHHTRKAGTVVGGITNVLQIMIDIRPQCFHEFSSIFILKLG